MSQEAQARESVHVDEQPIKVESDSEGRIYMLRKIHNIGLIGRGETGEAACSERGTSWHKTKARREF